ncbi:cysteine hydrolase family protein [Labedaea rhizosphaerae]|uniref:Nicotinamidase-related amidase n=1 Tax=Labedaea rhizosphaerae TaxID=598644 RepID=A0A4R6SG34_LABRH|nr:isochorismatase family cysteine hydrolase [Labedaea rhizosphaerae]TDP98046.1 nicotinamidase-related amidase [Labedaea rhizosphaerae]
MANQALLVMDVQNSVVSRIASDTEYLPRLAKAIDAARAAGVPVIYVVVGFRPGFPEVSSRNRMFGALTSGGANPATADAFQVHEAVAPRLDEVVVTKRRVSAFAGSDLDVVLRAKGIDTLVLTGIATSGVVLSTLRQAADLDFGLVVPADGCLDADPEVHRVLVEKVFARQAEITNLADWAASLRTS